MTRTKAQRHEGGKQKPSLVRCFSARSSRRIGSANSADSHRLVPGGSIGESAPNPKSADEMDWELAKLLRMRLIFLAIGRGTLRRARIDFGCSQDLIQEHCHKGPQRR